MAKETFYFSHDGNARNDEKIIAIRMKYNMEGYGIFFAILERLRGADEYKCIKDYNIIAFDLRVSADKVKSIVEDFGLFVFTEDGKYFYSESFDRRMKPLENTREQRRQAGLKSAQTRAKNQQPFNDRSTTVEQPFNDRSTTVEQKINKEKESKVNESKEDCLLPGGNETAPSKKEKINSFKQFTKQEFIEDIRQFEKDYTAKLRNDFFKYWSELSASGKMKFQLEKTWETKLRLDTWERMEIKFNQNGTNKSSYRGHHQSSTEKQSATSRAVYDELQDAIKFARAGKESN